MILELPLFGANVKNSRYLPLFSKSRGYLETGKRKIHIPSGFWIVRLSLISLPDNINIDEFLRRTTSALCYALLRHCPRWSLRHYTGLSRVIEDAFPFYYLFFSIRVSILLKSAFKFKFSLQILNSDFIMNFYFHLLTSAFALGFLNQLLNSTFNCDFSIQFLISKITFSSQLSNPNFNFNI